MRQAQCSICKHYSLYYMPAINKTVCANCKEIERANIVNAGVKKR